jgi:hypothetical protein
MMLATAVPGIVLYPICLESIGTGTQPVLQGWVQLSRQEWVAQEQWMQHANWPWMCPSLACITC